MEGVDIMRWTRWDSCKKVYIQVVVMLSLVISVAPGIENLTAGWRWT
jgi:hypothetical protein